jgi:hypothetical protein
VSVRKLGQSVVYRAIVRNFGLYIFTFLAGILGGVIGILPDLDHPLSLLLGIEHPRFIHTWVLIIACVVIVGCCAYFGGLLCWMVLERRDRRTL